MTSDSLVPASRAGSLPLVGSDIAFDFCNTSSGRGTEKFIEHFRSPQDVTAWARHAEVINAAYAEVLDRLSVTDAGFGTGLMARVATLRETIYRLGEAVAAGREPPEPLVNALAEAHAASLARARLVRHQKRYVWSWNPLEAPTDTILGPVALSAMTLLTQADLSRIKQCRGVGCGWLFFDTTKNKSRRWCEMEVCGNRAKQARHHSRREPRPEAQ